MEMISTDLSLAARNEWGLPIEQKETKMIEKAELGKTGLKSVALVMAQWYLSIKDRILNLNHSSGTVNN